jgi:hypothetical protein
MKTLFYLLLIIPLLYELVSFTNVEVYEFVRRAFYTKEIKYKDYTSNQKSYALCGGLYVLLTLIGLLSSQWILFLVILLISIMPRKIKYSRIGFLIDSSICSAILMFAIINHFHLHIDITAVVLNLFR